MGCCNNGWGGNGCLWIIILIIIRFQIVFFGSACLI